MLYQEKKGNNTFGTTYASYVTRTDMYLKNVQDRKPYKGGSKSGKYKGKYKKGKRFTKGRHIRATEMDDSSNEEEEVAESSQSNEEQVIRALMKK
jgi:hypothetical protein